MGMSASQARLLSLTARKSNVEFEGQQINQQRMALSNQSANLNKESLTLSPPKVPSVLAYTNTVYSWKSTGSNSTNTINEIVPSGVKDTFKVKYSTVEISPGAVLPFGEAGGQKISRTEVNPATYAAMSANPTVGSLIYVKSTDPSGKNPGDAGYVDTYRQRPATATDTAASSYTRTVEPTYQYKDSNGKVLTNVNAATGMSEELAALRTANKDRDDYLFYNGMYYSKTDVDRDADAANTSSANTQAYQFGPGSSADVEATTTAKFNSTASGLLQSITIGDKTYNLTATSVKDDVAYEAAMNEYNYQQDVYNKAIEDVNSKLAIVQSQDKNLETQLKQLDTEQEAIQTETDAVKKVIDKNIEQSFKAFG